jgi:hypothetical protein
MIEVAGGILIAAVVVLLVIALVRNPAGFFGLLAGLFALGCAVFVVGIFVSVFL